jgi:hypothetical protein
MNEENNLNKIRDEHHLTRYDTEPSLVIRERHYWNFIKVINKQYYGKTFTADEYGTIEAAYDAAIKYRDSFLREHGIPLIARGRASSETYLKRHDTKEIRKGRGTHRWFFQIRYNGKVHSKNFLDREFGSREESLKAAILYRDCFIKSNKIDISERFSFSETPGVHKTYSTDKKGNKKWYYQTTWIEGKNRAKRFSILKHGDEKALQLATAFKHQIDRHLQIGGSTAFITPENPNIKIWRYMDFTKFVYALDKSAFYFTHVDSLGDPYEGSYSRANTWIRKLAYSNANESRSLDEVLETMRETRKHIYVNCWHMNEGESVAMWRLYAKTNEAICIQSTYEHLKKQLPNYANIGMVNYIDYDKEWVPEDSIYNPFLFKRQSFQHEREIRAIIYSKDTRISCDIKKDNNGLSIGLDLNGLIDKVYVSPDSPDWFYELVKNVSTKYGIRKKVLKSSLDSEPMK